MNSYKDFYKELIIFQERKMNSQNDLFKSIASKE